MHYRNEASFDKFNLSVNLNQKKSSCRFSNCFVCSFSLFHSLKNKKNGIENLYLHFTFDISLKNGFRFIFNFTCTLEYFTTHCNR